jgi:hypothetical protein
VSESRVTLLRELAQHAYQYNEEKPFLLVSGALSPEYLDCKLALGRPVAMAAMSRPRLLMPLPGITSWNYYATFQSIRIEL